MTKEMSASWNRLPSSWNLDTSVWIEGGKITNLESMSAEQMGVIILKYSHQLIRDAMGETKPSNELSEIVVHRLKNIVKIYRVNEKKYNLAEHIVELIKAMEYHWSKLDQMSCVFLQELERI